MRSRGRTDDEGGGHTDIEDDNLVIKRSHFYLDL